MDALFSNIQQSLQKNDKDELLNQQQISQDKINELLEESSKALLCGPTCQKIKVSAELKQRYLDAETNVKTAPIEAERAKKNYYVYTEGETAYNNKLEDELNKKATEIAKALSENFIDEFSSSVTMNQYLNTSLINSSHTKDLLKEYIEKNKLLKIKMMENRNDILTNDRKTYYETQELDRLKSWYKIWFSIYYVLVLTFLICWFVCPSEFTWKVKTVLTILIVFYPYYIDYIFRGIYRFIMGFYKNLPKNVYNDL